MIITPPTPARRPPARPDQPMQRQRGAALLTAMIIVTLVATLASSMIWQQWRAVQIETAERARSQSAWILSGALDFGRLMLRESGGANKPTALTDQWAVPLAEARLSTFLAADKNNTDDGPEAFLSGIIIDAQARYNLRNLVQTEEAKQATELAVLKRLCGEVGVSGDVADRIAAGMLAAAPAEATTAAPLLPETVTQLRWFGIDDASVRLLEPFVVLLPEPTPINVNTASRQVFAAVSGADPGIVGQMMELQQSAPIQDQAALATKFPNPPVPFTAERLATVSGYFEVWGRLRLNDRVLEERSLVKRVQKDVTVLRRERVASRDQPAS